MQSRTRLLRTLEPLAFRALPGAVADVWSVEGREGGGGHYLAPDPRLVIFLDDVPPPLTLHPGAPDSPGTVAQAFYIPAGLPLSSRMQRDGRMTHLDLHLAAETLDRRLKAGGLRADLTRPLLLERSPALVTLGRLAAEEIRRPRAGTMLLDGLFTAALAEVFAPARTAPPDPSDPPDPPAAGRDALAPWQMAALHRLAERNLSRPISVAEMAAAVRMSESWFAHAFRAQTGQPPQRWLAGLRLTAAARLMAETDLPLAAVAQATGFADQAHFSRRFREAHGLTPSAWRRQQIRSPDQIAAVGFKTAAEF